MINDPKFAIDLINNLLKTFVEPELSKRGQSGKKVKLYRVLIIVTHPNPIVLLNEEVKVIISHKLRPSIDKPVMSPIFADEIDENFNIQINEPLCTNYQYFLMLFINDNSYLKMHTPESIIDKLDQKSRLSEN